MTTLPRYHGVDEILRGLDFVRARRWLVGLAAGLLAVAAVAMGAVVVLGASLGYWEDQPPVALRWALLGVSAAAVLAAAGWYVLRVLFWRPNPAQLARYVEQVLPGMRNDLINAVLLSTDADQVSPELVQMAIREAAVRARREDIRRSVSPRPLLRWAAAAAGVGLLLAGFAAFQPGPLKRGLRAALAPTAYVPRVNELELVSLAPADGATVLVGRTVHIVANIRNETARPYVGKVLLRGESAPREMFPANAFSTFTLPIQNVQQSFEFAVRIGRSRWPADRPYYRVNVLQRVGIEGLDLKYEYPAYTKLQPRLVRNAAGGIEAPIGSRVTVTLRTASPAGQVVLEHQDGRRIPMRPDGARRQFAATMDILADGAYRVVLTETRQQLPDPEASPGGAFGPAGESLLKGYYRIRAVPDEPPKIEFLSPNRDVTVPPGGTLSTALRVFDKYGLTDARFYAGREGAEPKEIHRFPVAGKAKADLAYDLKLPEGLVKGDVLVYYATVTDNRNLPTVGGPQTTASGRFKVLVQDPAEAAAEKARLYEELRKRLLAILEKQAAARVDTGICWKQHKALADITATGGRIVAAQKTIRLALLELAEKFPFAPEMLPVQQAVAILANNEARLAVSQAQVVAQLASLEGRETACRQLAGTQDRILETLQTLLAIMPSLARKEGEPARQPDAADLPPETQEKLKQLSEAMEKFLEDQKRVIEATDRLNKKPVDNFNAEDEELLKDLIATEDKWEKFMKEAFADFSRLVEQDFSNPAMLKELMSVKTDVTMAKDALTKKATEIATAAEDGALGGGEEIVSNIEKWLPDEPDRTKWAMEAMPEDMGKIEMPELPTELEDLVGDLLEQEEELFEEMEDLSARAASSGSDGIGWDAMDGPISNMGAQGVTGNQLPNSNELSGRSGEGRSGKSSGEFVEDKAVGKGGRRTPTRLTPEPFQKGQVNDTSTEPPGGATGGGKFSGAGAEGLEGPVPPEIKKEMPRLAQKQAALLNRAERIQGRFQVNDYAAFKFLEAVTLMNRVAGDLRSGRYQNVLRAKDATLSALRQSRLRIGQIDVQADTTAAMPKYIRDNIADAMKGKLPEEFKDVLQQYYRRLSEAPGR